MTEQTSATEDLKDYFIKRINAGLPLTLEEWGALEDNCKDVWEETYQEYVMKSHALQAHYIADTLAGGRLAVDTIFDILPEKIQDEYMKKWSLENADEQRD